MYRIVPAFVAAGFAILCADPARAEGAHFGYSYGAETAEAGETELELWVTDRRGKGEGHYDAQDYRIEVERGITDRFEIAVYANLASHHIRGLEPRFDDLDRDLAFGGLSAEFKYNLIKPSRRGVGLTLYAEPGWSRVNKISGEKATEYELELKAIVQKNFADDRLVGVANLTLEPEWEHESEVLPAPGEETWKEELKVEVTTGLAYRVTPRWSLGVEGRYHSVYPDWTRDLHREAYAVSAGPTVHFSGGKWGVTATWLPQLFGSPNAAGSGLSLDEYEKREFRVKVGYEL
jgi:hypothetical protein